MDLIIENKKINLIKVLTEKHVVIPKNHVIKNWLAFIRNQIEIEIEIYSDE